MTELALIDTTTTAVARRDPGQPQLGAGVAALAQFAEATRAAGQIVASIVDTPFFPAALVPKLTGSSDEHRALQRAGAIANGTGAILHGTELGLSPMAALNNIIVIHGRPSLYAETMVALVQAAGHEVWTESESDTKVVVCGQRAGSDKVERATFTIERARKAGYVAKNAKYGTDPQAMLYARAASIACRRTAPEVLKGIPVFEDVQDWGPDRPSAPAVVAAPVSVAEITGGPSVEPDPEPADEVEVVDDEDYPRDQAPAEPEQAGVSRELQRRMFAQFRDLGLSGDTERDARLAVASQFVGRDLASSNDLSEEEAHDLIDALGLHVEMGDDGREIIAAMARKAMNAEAQQ